MATNGNGVGPAERNENIKKLRELMKDIDICMLTTIDDDTQALRSRPMSTQQVEFDGDLWFFTQIDTAKVDQVQQERNVNVSYTKHDSDLYISVSGKATVVRDQNKMEELWQPALKAWFPGGLDDPQLALLRVSVEQAEYWDGPNKVAQLIGMVKAIATGQEYHPGENEKINFK